MQRTERILDQHRSADLESGYQASENKVVQQQKLKGINVGKHKNEYNVQLKPDLRGY